MKLSTNSKPLRWNRRLRLRTSGIYRVDAIPGCKSKTGGSAADAASRSGLAPEPALRLHPCRALSSAPVSISVENRRSVSKFVIVVVGRNNCRRPGKVIDARHAPAFHASCDVEVRLALRRFSEMTHYGVQSIMGYLS